MPLDVVHDKHQAYFIKVFAMQSQSDHSLYRQQTLMAMLLVCGASIAGGSVGLLVGRQANLVFGVDAGIIGLIAGAVFGGTLLPAKVLKPALGSVAVGLGVLLPALLLIGSARIAPAVVWGMVAVAMLCSGLISLMIRCVRHVGREHRS